MRATGWYTDLEHRHAAGERRLAARGAEGVGAAPCASRHQHPSGVGQVCQHLCVSKILDGVRAVGSVGQGDRRRGSQLLQRSLQRCAGTATAET